MVVLLLMCGQLVNRNVNREIIPWAETSPWPLKATVAGSSKEIPAQLYLNP